MHVVLESPLSDIGCSTTLPLFTVCSLCQWLASDPASAPAQDAAHTFVKSLFPKFSSSTHFECAICFLLETDTDTCHWFKKEIYLLSIPNWFLQIHSQLLPKFQKLPPSSCQRVTTQGGGMSPRTGSLQIEVTTGDQVTPEDCRMELPSGCGCR